MKSVRLITRYKITVWRNTIWTTRTAANVCDVNDLIHSQKKANHTLQTMRLQHLRLCTPANIPEPVNDGLQMKQRLIAVWSGLQQILVDEAVDKWVDEWVRPVMDTNLRICYNVWSSTFSVNILTLSCWNFCVWRCVSLNYYGALANAVVVSGKT